MKNILIELINPNKNSVKVLNVTTKNFRGLNENSKTLKILLDIHDLEIELKSIDRAEIYTKNNFGTPYKLAVTNNLSRFISDSIYGLFRKGETSKILLLTEKRRGTQWQN